MRRIFLSGMLSTFLSPLVVSAGEPHWLKVLLDSVDLRGLNSLAEESAMPVAVKAGLLFALVASGVAALAFAGSEVDSRAQGQMARLSRSEKVLYALIGLVMVILPWVVDSPSKPHQFSYSFFRLVGSSSIVLAVFCTGVYVYTAATLIFIQCLFRVGGRK